MPPIQSRPPYSHYIGASCLLICVASLAFASRGLFTGYSYWLDEIFSVSASLDTWQQLYERWILRDVHPPLYQVALKVWMSFFGSTEVATRVLSFSFSVVTLGAFSFDAIVTRRWRRVLALLLVSASPFFAYYSQETRSYSLVLALSSIVTLAALELRSRDSLANPSSGQSLSLAYYLGSLLLSLTHYFGWIYVFVLSLIGFWENKLFKARARLTLLVAAISLWPAWHVVIGDLGGKSGGDFWIKVSSPIVGTINTYLNGCLPLTAVKWSSYLFVLAWSLLAAMAFVAAGNWQEISSFIGLKSKKLGAVADESRFSLLSIVLVVGIMSIVDLHTPMSTTRNYIVLLPATMLLLSNSLVMLASSRGAKSPSGVAAAFLVLVILLLLSRQSWTGLSGKIQPYQNWKSLASYVKKTGICSEGCFLLGSSGLHDYYFSGSGSFRDLSLERGADADSQARASWEDQIKYINGLPDAKILGFHFARAKIPDLLSGGKDRQCIQPTQAWDGSTFLILPSVDLTGKEKGLGMQSCGLVDKEG